MTLNPFKIPSPYLLFTGEATSPQTTGKTAAGVAYWSKEKCLGQLWLESTRLDLGLPHFGLREAVEKGAQTLLIGVSALGGKFEEKWIGLFVEALKNGLHLAAGLHTRLSDVPQIKEAAEKYHRKLFDVRYYDGPVPLSRAEKRIGKRLLTVGTDCAVGKMYAALAITEALKKEGVDATFRATGQTGILIAGSGIAIDNIAADFLFNAVELLSPNAPANHWDIIEGQGALFHPQSAGGSLFLVHGSQPDVMVLCHNPARKTMSDFERYPIPDLAEYIRAYEEAARLTNPNARVEGISLNTSQFKEKEKKHELIKIHEQKYGLPCFDPVLTGVHPFVDAFITRHGR
ncbi:MAG TPA: DUF1611 domain-containing protein [Chlamydiales bacterium]